MFDLVNELAIVAARNDIIDNVWGRSVIVTGRSVDRCVATLRAKVEPDPRCPTFIQTIRDIGYRFEIPAEEPTGLGGVPSA